MKTTEEPKPFPFFIAAPRNIYRFLSYVQSEDLYGHVIPEQWWDVMPVLEAHGVLKREAPNGEWVPRRCPPDKYVAPLLIELDYPGLSSWPDKLVPMSYCPYPLGEIPFERFGATTIQTQTIY